MCVGIIGIKINSGAKLRDRFIEELLAGQCDTEVIVCVTIIGVEFDRGLKLLDRGVYITARGQIHAAIIMLAGIIYNRLGKLFCGWLRVVPSGLKFNIFRMT